MNDKQRARAARFIEGIVDHPADRRRRAEFADWLDSLGLPHAARCQRAWDGPPGPLSREARLAVETQLFERAAGLD